MDPTSFRRCASLLLPAFFSLFSAATEKPNVILVVADNLGYGDLACYGSQVNRTPVLDRSRFNATRPAREGLTPRRQDAKVFLGLCVFA